jgi:NTE family protein
MQLPATHNRPARIAGAFDTTRLEQLVLDQIEWEKIRRNLADGSLDALAVTATEIATGRSVVFVDTPTDQLPVWTRDPFIIARAAQIDASHTLASAAIPLLFPAVRIGQTYYCDGGLRLNTPLVPALRLGADRVLIIGLRHPVSQQEQDRLARSREVSYSNPAFLAGKALNALLLDRVETDVDRLRLFNAILQCGKQVYGEDFLVRINEPIIERRNTPYRIVSDLFLRPSEDLGEIAAKCLKHQPRASSVRTWLTRGIARYAASGSVIEADLLSYLFFDRCYADHLIELGRRDAERVADELTSFLFDTATVEEKE